MKLFNMPHASSVEISSSISLLMDKKETADSHFRWSSIINFLYMSCTVSATAYNFDIFSNICGSVRLFDFIFFEVTVGMAYMYMECFIKQYTKRLDCNRLLNPLLRAVTLGALLQTCLWTLLHAGYLADSMQFFGACFQTVPSWSLCQKSTNGSCINTEDVLLRCQNSQALNFSSTSAHFHYMKSFSNVDKTMLTTNFFATAVVWILTFLLSAVTDETLLKFYKLAYICRLVSTLLTVSFIMLNMRSQTLKALAQILDVRRTHSYISAMPHIAYAYSIGLLGFYDFGSVSPYMMTDNAVVIYTIISTSMALIRSLIVKTLYMVLTECIDVRVTATPHYLVFAILPLSTEFLYLHKLYNFYIYGNIMFAMMAYLTMLTSTMSKFLHNEFRSVKIIYIVGILCFMGFVMYLPVTTVSMMTSSRVKGLISGLNVSLFYVGSLKALIIMWIYGVQKFSTDIDFWLGYKPTKFWIICWAILPLILMFFVIKKVYLIYQLDNDVELVAASLWILLSFLIVFIFLVKTIARYIMRNNLAAIFKCSSLYGPPDPDDRKSRKTFNDTLRHRQCQHDCLKIDDLFDCTHMALMDKSKSMQSTISSEATSLTNLYENRQSARKRTSIMILNP